MILKLKMELRRIELIRFFSFFFFKLNKLTTKININRARFELMHTLVFRHPHNMSRKFSPRNDLITFTLE